MSERDSPGGGGGFPTTHWSVVRAAASKDPEAARAALADLCQAYWYPLYAFARRSGASAEDAQDLVQGFFARFLARDYLGELGPDAGKFRSYLLAALRHYMSNERDRERAAKRGGGIAGVPLRIDFAEGERYHAHEPATDLTPELLFHQRWALVLLRRVRERLRREYVAAGRVETFERLEGFLPAGPPGTSYKEAAERLGVSMDNVKVAIYRLRRRYGDVLRDEIARTVSTPEEVEGEIEFLLDVLAR